MEIDSLITWSIAIGLLLIFVLPYFLVHRRREKKVEALYEKAFEKGLEEPDTLHPVINPNACLCTGNCVSVCPEQDVLGLLNGTALAINPTKCVGHGLCERACPVDAIQLVVGTSKRGVDIPMIQENFETNVPGMFVIGELGGMGLIRNAFEQARQCVDGIVRNNENANGDVLDVLIVGCGPAGLAASLNCKHKGLRFLTIEKEDIGGTVRYYPRKKLVMTSPVDVPGYGKLKIKDIVKEELISLWTDIVETTGLRENIHTHEMMVKAIKTDAGHFTIDTDKGRYNAKHVILAVGRRGMPRKLGVTGEDGSNVAFSMMEPEHYQNNAVMVVGGGDSAVECAIALADQPGNKVRLSYRKDVFTRIKADNQERLDNALTDGKIEFMPSTSLTAIDKESVSYVDAAGASHKMENEYVFVMIGGTLPTAMLRDLGIDIDTKFGEPLRS